MGECAGCYQDVVKIQRTDVKVLKGKVGPVDVKTTTKRVDKSTLKLYWRASLEAVAVLDTS